ncbi:hypothetical protein YT1_2884 [Rhodococcus ruber]|nr:hypothetical protein YT1_2884 [Rhodococcus ruber]
MRSHGPVRRVGRYGPMVSGGRRRPTSWDLWLCPRRREPGRLGVQAILDPRRRR